MCLFAQGRVALLHGRPSHPLPAPLALPYPSLLMLRGRPQVECWTYGVDAGMALLQKLLQQGMKPDRATWSTLLACELQEGARCRPARRSRQLVAWRRPPPFHTAARSSGSSGMPPLFPMPPRSAPPMCVAAARKHKRGDVADVALEELEALRQHDAAAAAEGQAERAAEAGPAEPQEGEGDHRWHGYYEQATEQDDDW